MGRQCVLSLGSAVVAGLLLMGASAFGSADQPLRSIQQIVMANSMVGWALADQHIVRTSDGGRLWTVVGPAVSGPSSTLTDVTMQHAALAISEPTGVPDQSPRFSTLLWVTSDGGARWRDTIVPWSGFEPVQSLQLFTSGLGWVLTANEPAAGNESAVLLHTTNGGDTWNTLPSSIFPGQSAAKVLHGIPYFGDKAGVSFLSARIGWVAGGDEGPTGVLFMRTTNGGQSFYPQTLIPPAGYVIGNANPPIFSTRSVGWIPLTLIPHHSQNPSALGFEVTTDSGQTWHPVQKVFAKPPRIWPTVGQPTWSFVGRQRGWVLASGQLYRSVNTGRQWQRVAQAPAMTEGIDFISPQVGWAFGTGTIRLWKTTDGGRRWRPVRAHIISEPF